MRFIVAADRGDARDINTTAMLVILESTTYTPARRPEVFWSRN